MFRSVDSPQITNQCTAVSQSGNPTGADCAPAASPCFIAEALVQAFEA